VQFRIYSIKSAVNVELLNRDEKWLKTFVRNKLMLKNRKERFIEIAEEMKKSVQMNYHDFVSFIQSDDQYHEELVNEIKRRRFINFHNSFFLFHFFDLLLSITK
jgi:ABC-type Zn2+ transport system substrate-binding protein/surface adhesin